MPVQYSLNFRIDLEVVLTAIREIRVIRGSSYLLSQISAPLPDNTFPFQTPILEVDEQAEIQLRDGQISSHLREVIVVE